MKPLKVRLGDCLARNKFHEDRPPVLRNNLGSHVKRKTSISGIEQDSDRSKNFMVREMTPKNLSERLKEITGRPHKVMVRPPRSQFLDRVSPVDKKNSRFHGFNYDKPQRSRKSRMIHRKPKENNFSINSKFEGSLGGGGSRRTENKHNKKFMEKLFFKDYILKGSKLPKFPSSKTKKKRNK